MQGGGLRYVLVACIIAMLGNIYVYFFDILGCSQADSLTPTVTENTLEFLNILSLIISSLFYGTVNRMWLGTATHFLLQNSFSAKAVYA